MDLQELRDLATAIPFSPFQIHLRNGQVLTFTRPHQMAVSPTDEFIGYFTDIPGEAHRRAFTDEILSWNKVKNAEAEVA